MFKSLIENEDYIEALKEFSPIDDYTDIKNMLGSLEKENNIVMNKIYSHDEIIFTL